MTQVVLDTNILIGAVQSRKLPPWLTGLASHAKKDDITLVVPVTVAMELEHKRDAAIAAEKEEHAKLAKALSKAGAAVDLKQIDYREDFDIVRQLQSIGFHTRIEYPTLADYAEAHRKSCLHLFPIGNEEKDSSRDLVILTIAQRLATTDPSTILVANDDLFHRTGSDSADYKLNRVRSLLSIFTLLTPDSVETAQLMQSFLHQLKKQSLVTFSESELIWKQFDIQAITRESGTITHAQAHIKMTKRGEEPKHRPPVVEADIEINHLSQDGTNEYHLIYTYEGKEHSFVMPAPALKAHSNLALEELRGIIGGTL